MNCKELLHLAHRYARCSDLERSRDYATQAVLLDPGCVEAYLQRGWIYWQLELFDESISDFNQVIFLDIDNDDGWFARGTSRLCKGCRLVKDHQQKSILYQLAHDDFKKGAALNPANIRLHINWMELSILSGQYKAAIGLSGTLWPNIVSPEIKLACAWLSACSLILAGRPSRHWSRYVRYLKKTSCVFGPEIWYSQEMDIYLETLRQNNFDQKRLDLIHSIYKKFLGHIDNTSVYIF